MYREQSPHTVHNEAVPPIDQFRPAVLRVLSDGVECSSHQIADAAAALLGLSDAALSQRIESGQFTYRDRSSWACSSLVFAALLDRPRRGV